MLKYIKFVSLSWVQKRVFNKQSVQKNTATLSDFSGADFKWMELHRIYRNRRCDKYYVDVRASQYKRKLFKEVLDYIWTKQNMLIKEVHTVFQAAFWLYRKFSTKPWRLSVISVCSLETINQKSKLKQMENLVIKLDIKNTHFAGITNYLRGKFWKTMKKLSFRCTLL